jgi:hypothetical protein
MKRRTFKKPTRKGDIQVIGPERDSFRAREGPVSELDTTNQSLK